MQSSFAGFEVRDVARNAKWHQDARSVEELKRIFQYQMIFIVIMTAALAGAQQQKSPSDLSKVDIFAGYAYWAPSGYIAVPGYSELPGGTASFAHDNGLTLSGAYYLNRKFGLELAGDWYFHNGDNDSMHSISTGPIFRYSMASGWTPFVHALVGAAEIVSPCEAVSYSTGCEFDPSRWGAHFVLGGGIDYTLPIFHRHLAGRIAQVDYLYNRINPAPYIGTKNMSSLRLSGGFVWSIGSIPPVPSMQFACTASPDSIYPGEPVIITGLVSKVEPRKAITYSWYGYGVLAEGARETTVVSSANLRPGTYTVVGHAEEGKKAGESAECTVHFSVKESENRK